MITTLRVQWRRDEFCRLAELPEECLVEIVEQGIIEPSGDTPEQWLFDAAALDIARRAARLQRDLEIDWAGIALALNLLEELDELRAENRMLRQRLSRFVED
ncbi:chaperone modulator CbpM [Pseudomonas zhanjiangensis]|uniref:Chaperone modulator CbpM n=1 Tax=Pseudomonas zhanjiangensis TaxID=3239015 RepID=A0ABV3YYQ2_9PSED